MSLLSLKLRLGGVKENLDVVSLAIFFGFIVPPFVGCLWDDPLGTFVWGGLVSRLASMPLLLLSLHAFSYNCQSGIALFWSIRQFIISHIIPGHLKDNQAGALGRPPTLF